jgi:phosphatidylethanolamine/phosphatidyl-N-methylethanolamine N-methyltransferase
VTSALSPQGVFTTFAYSHVRWSTAARQFRKTLDHQFFEVVAGPTVWANMPPAFVYRCRPGSLGD